MTQPNPNQTRNLYIGVAVVVALILVGGGVYWYSTSNKSNSDSSNSSTSTSTSTAASTQNSTVATPAPLTAATLAGKYTGAGNVLSAALNFPQTTIEFKSDESFSLNADGLSLSLLGEPTLQVNGVYPTVKLVAAGKYKLVDAKNVNISVSSIALNFFANGQALPAENQVQLGTALSGAGFAVPAASETVPLSIPVTVDVADSQLTIKNTAQSAVVIGFVGKKA